MSLPSNRPLGAAAPPAIGLGCMNLSHAYGTPPPPEEGRRLLQHAFELGVVHFDTAALYGFGTNETLVGQALKSQRSQITLASKCGMTGVDGKRVIDGRPETLSRTCEESLTRLQTDFIDLYYLHRFDRRVPIEDSVGALADLVVAGKIGGIGLSEVSASTLRRAHAVHPIAAVQSEYSLWTRNPELAVLDATAELDVAFVAFSPVGRGYLADLDLDPAGFSGRDIRANMPRFQEPHFSANASWRSDFRDLATELGCAPATLALAWVLARGKHVHAIPGTKSRAHLEEDWAALSLSLSDEAVMRLDGLINRTSVSGSRYAEATQKEIDTEEFAA